MPYVTVSGSHDDLRMFLEQFQSQITANVKISDIAEEPDEEDYDIAFELDYDWKNANGSDASGIVEINATVDDDGARQLLIDYDDEIKDEFGQDYVCFMPDNVNDLETPSRKDMAAEDRNYCSTVRACLYALRQVPGTRSFQLTGSIC